MKPIVSPGSSSHSMVVHNQVAMLFHCTNILQAAMYDGDCVDNVAKCIA